MAPSPDLPPKRIDAPAAWIGADMAAHPERWQMHLSGDEIAELEGAARAFLERSGDFNALTRETFPLPSFGSRLAELRGSPSHFNL